MPFFFDFFTVLDFSKLYIMQKSESIVRAYTGISKCPPIFFWGGLFFDRPISRTSTQFLESEPEDKLHYYIHTRQRPLFAPPLQKAARLLLMYTFTCPSETSEELYVYNTTHTLTHTHTLAHTLSNTNNKQQTWSSFSIFFGCFALYTSQREIGIYRLQYI